MAKRVTKRSVESWLVEFSIMGNPIETVEVNRAYAPTRWAKNHVLTLKRKHQGADVTFNITAC